MIWLPVVILSFTVFLVRSYLLRRTPFTGERHGMTGCEVARQLLDLAGFSQVGVEASQIGRPVIDTGIRTLTLKSQTYHGRTLEAFTDVAREVALRSSAQNAIAPPDVKKRIWVVLEGMILVGWFLLLARALGFEGGAGPGRFLLAASFILALTDLPHDWEISERAYALLRQYGKFEIKDLSELKRRLRAQRLTGLACLFQVPANRLLQIMSSLGRKSPWPTKV